MRDCWREGYTPAKLRDDLLAGLVVGIVALPLSMALAIASGVPPQHGLYTAVVAGAIAALLGGSRVQVTGPTAAFVVILAPITAKFGLAGLAITSFVAGGLQLAMGWLRLGRLIQFVPHPVTTGFTAGIAVVIATLQLKDFFGLTIEHMPEHYLGRVAAIVMAMPTLNMADLVIGVVTLALLWAWTKWGRVLPAPLIALTAAALLGLAITHLQPQVHVQTISSRFASADAPYGVPQALPPLLWPWNSHAPGDPPIEWSLDTVEQLALSALAIAMLGAIESLLSAVVADGMSGTRHDPDAELSAQGVGNLIAPFFGGFAATGAIARTAANIRFGARSPIAAVIHAVFILLSLLLLAPLLGYLPMAGLAALLLRVAWTMSEAKHFIHSLRRAPTSDVAVLVCCFALTVVFDMVVAVLVGVVLAALLFIGRVASMTDSRLIEERYHPLDVQLPAGVAIYEVAGPLFFGAAQRALTAVTSLRRAVHIVVIDMRSVPVMDLTGLIALESAINHLRKRGLHVIIAGVQKQPLQVMAKAHMHRDHDQVTFCGSFEHGLHMAMMLGHLTHESDIPQPTAPAPN